MNRFLCRLLLAVSIMLAGGIFLFSGASVPMASPRVWQRRQPRRVDPQAQLLEYYRRYPDRYIRVSKESWKYEQRSRTALHSFTLRNTATVRYCEIEISFSYLASGGKTLHTEHVRLPDLLEALRSLDVYQLKVKKVPDGAETAVVRVTKASICR